MIRNLTKKTAVCLKERFCRTISSKAKGLMFSKGIVDEGLIFVFEKPARVDLHMFFVFFPIDVIYLDSQRKVIEIKERFMPFTLFSPVHKASYVIEVPEGTIRQSRCSVGDLLEF